MTTVKADGEVAPYEDMENATLLQKECYDLDEDTMICLLYTSRCV